MSKDYFKLLFFLLVILLCLSSKFSLSEDSKYGSNFNSLKKEYLGEEKFVNNDNIKIIIQEEVEEAHEVAMVVKFPEELKINNQIAILVDNNPIQLVTKIFPDSNRNAAGPRFFKYLIDQNLTYQEFIEYNKLYCPVSGSLINPFQPILVRGFSK